MQQLDNMDIAGNQIAVTIAPLSQAEAAAAAAAAASALDLDDAEGVLHWPQSHTFLGACKAALGYLLSCGPSLAPRGRMWRSGVEAIWVVKRPVRVVKVSMEG